MGTMAFPDMGTVIIDSASEDTATGSNITAVDFTAFALSIVSILGNCHIEEALPSEARGVRRGSHGGG